MSVYVMNGFRTVTESRFFGEVNGIEVDNVYDNTIFYRAINEINEKKIEHYESNDYDLSSHVYGRRRKDIYVCLRK